MSRSAREHEGLFVVFEALAGAYGAPDPTGIAHGAFARLGDADIEAVTMIETVDWIREVSR